MFYKIYQKLFFIFLFSFATLFNSSALNSNQNLFVQDLPVFCFLNNAKESIELLQQEFSPNKPMQILEDINALLDLTKSIIRRFEDGMFSYNPGIWYQFLKICKSFKTINELNPADIRDLAEKINSFNKKLNLYFKSREQFFNESEISLCNDIKAFNLLLLGEVLKDDFLQFSFSEKLLDYIYYQPKEFIEAYQGFFISGGILSAGILVYFAVPYLKKMFSGDKNGVESNGNGYLIVSDINGKKITVPSGCKNLGNTCFMNVALQCFANDSELSDSLIDNKERFKNNLLIYSFAKLLANLRKNENACVPEEFFEIAIPDFFSNQRNYNPNKQQDASEFVTKLLSQIKEEYEKQGLEIKEYDISLKRKFTCSSCKVPDDSVVADFAESLDIHIPAGLKQISLIESVTSFSDEEVVDRDCPFEGCGGKKAASSLEIETHPEKLIINLKRFGFREDGTKNGKTEKNKTLVLFNPDNFEISGEKYQLTNFICHRGATANGGHYFSFVRNSELNQWFKYDDSTRTEISDEKIKQIISIDGKADGAEPYVLFFKKKE